MLGFAAIVDLAGAPVAPDAATALGTASMLPGATLQPFFADGISGVQVAHEHALDCARSLPCRSDDGMWLLGALRLDNRDALRRALSAAGTTLDATTSDAELAMAAWRTWGERCAERLMGDFAFAVWNARTRDLFCARDHHGNRQLYWGRDGSRVVVASSVQGVRAYAPLATGWREESLASFLQLGYVDEPTHTTWRDVQRLPPAHTLALSAGAPDRLRRYWSFPVPEPIRYRDGAQYVEHFREVLGAAVRDRLREPTAAVLLSGGLDSPMLAATARAVTPQVTLFAQTVSYPRTVPSDDEFLAPLVARHLGIAHEHVHCDDLHALQWLDGAEAYPAEPVDDPDIDVLRRSYRALARHSPVTLFGEDGDTLMRPPTLAGQLRGRGVAEVVAAWWSFWRTHGRRPWAGLEWRERLRRALGREEDRTPWLRASMPRIPTPSPFDATHPVRPRTVRLLSSRLWESVYQGNAPSHTGAATLATLPLVDPRVIEFVFAIPGVPWGEGKQLFREAMRGRLPDEILSRRKTPLLGYFEVRVAQWRAAGGTSVKLSERVAPWVDRARVEALYRDGDPLLVVEAWRALILDRWMQRMEGARA